MFLLIFVCIYHFGRAVRSENVSLNKKKVEEKPSELVVVYYTGYIDLTNDGICVNCLKTGRTVLHYDSTHNRSQILKLTLALGQMPQHKSHLWLKVINW